MLQHNCHLKGVKKYDKKITIALLSSAFLLGPFLSSALALKPVTMNTTVEKVYKVESLVRIADKVESLVRIADNVIIMFDSSGSMGEPFGDTGMTKLQAAKKILKERAESLPEAIPGLKIGLYSYTPPASVSAGPSEFEVRGGPVCLNSQSQFYKWIEPSLVMPPLSQAAS